MKKLLSLLSVLTIGVSIVPTTIAASHYQKQENKNIKNIDINYQQINNLENLKREKRENNNFPHKDAPNLNVSGSVSDYYKSLCEIIIYLRTKNIIREIRGDEMYDPSEQLSTSSDRPVSCGIDINFNPRERYFINRDSNYNYFIIPFVIENETNQQSNRVRMIYRTRDFYLLWFIVNGNYYYFANEDDTKDIKEYKNNKQKLDEELKKEKNINFRHPEIKILNIGSNNHYNLRYGGDYISLTRAAINNDQNRNFGNPQITWEGISDSFFQISNIGTIHNPSNDILAASLIRIILATSESVRFKDVFNSIFNSVPRRNFEGISVYWNNFIEIIKNWLKLTKEAINYLLENGNLVNYPRIEDIAIFADIMSDYFKSCNNRKPRNLNNNEYCVYLLEKNIYYNDDKSDVTIETVWDSTEQLKIVKDFNLGKINPLNFIKIDFIGKEDNFKLTRTSWGNRAYYDGWFSCKVNYYNGSKISDIISHFKVENTNDIKNNANLKIQDKYLNWSGGGGAGDETFTAKQSIGLTWYNINDNYHLQFLVYQYGSCSSYCWHGGTSFMGIGSGIRLYNE